MYKAVLFKNLPGILSVFLFMGAYAQRSGLRTTLPADSIYRSGIYKGLETKYKQDVEQVKGDYKKYIKEIYKERYDYIKVNIDSNAIITDPEAVAYINRLSQKILEGNPYLQKLNPRILLSKAWWPNASSMGEGTVFVNIGIIYKFLNEAQLAFVICHELAHLYLDHGNKAIEKYVNTLYDPEFQKELKRISKLQYEKNKELKSIEKGITYKSRRHNREKEREADSMAIEFLKNTDFSLEEAKTALAMLDSIDNDKYNIPPPIQKYFNNTAFPFKKAWMKEEEVFFGGVNAKITDQQILDSLKTHPDCRQRVVNVTPLIEKHSKQGGILYMDEPAFKKWQQKFDFEVIAFEYDRGAVSVALYQALQTLENYPNDPWLLAMIGNCLNRLYMAQKKHVLNQIVELPSPYEEKKYNDFLVFIQNLSLSDIAGISYYFMEDNKAAGISNEDYVYALIQSKEHFGKADEKQTWINYYKTNFSNQPSYKF